MKPLHFAALAGTMLVTALVLLFTGASKTGVVQQAAAESPRLVTATGEGEVRPKPDLAWVNVNITTSGASALEAGASHVASVKKIAAAMVVAGAEEPTIDPSQIAISTQTQDFPGSTRSTVFRANSLLKVQVKNISKVQAVVDAALAIPETSLGSVAYTVELPEKVRQQAVSQALKVARDRAKAMTKDQGVSLLDLRSMEIVEDSIPPAGDHPDPLLFKVQVRVVFDFQ